MVLFSEKRLMEILPVGGLGKPLHYHGCVASTNDEAVSLAQHGAAHGTLVIAEHQSKGRGRGKKRWSTVSGASIAFSLILHLENGRRRELTRLNAIGALGVIEALGRFGLAAQMKWPNDVLLAGRKVAGVLAEVFWQGEKLDFVVLGVGINLLRGSVPDPAALRFPAISISEVAEKPIDPHLFLRAVLEGISDWISWLGAQNFWMDCQRHLAYLGQTVAVEGGEGCIMGKLLGIDEGGGLRIMIPTGEVIHPGFQAHSLSRVNDGEAKEEDNG